MAFSKAMIIGNLGRDPEMRYTPSGRPVTEFSVAVNQSTKNQQTGEWVEATDWFRVTVWGDRAERTAEQFRKGNRVFVEGRFRTRGYEPPTAGAPATPGDTRMPPRTKKRDDYYRDRRRRKVCSFCADKTVSIDYKEVNRLRRYLSERAKIEPRRKTGTCAAHQRELSVALKRARHVALLPYAPQHLRP